MQVWTRVATRSGGVPLDIRPRLRVTARRSRTVMRVVIMGYVAFAVIVAAGGALILWLWWRHYRSIGSAPLNRVGYAANGLPLDPIPPFKRTVSGPSEKDRELWDFEARLDAWQQTFQSRRDHKDTNPHVLKGKKYHFVPKAREGGEVSNSA